MESEPCLNIDRQAEELFNFYDRARIGIISKKALLSYVQLIDKLITEQLLLKFLLPHGLCLPEQINCQTFTQILGVLSCIPELDDYSQLQD